MKKIFMMLVASIVCSQVVIAQSRDAVITRQINADGSSEVINIEQVPREMRRAAMTFESADENGDGCVDRQEARNAGILSFNRFNRSNPRCLNAEEFDAAMRSPN